jgi:hypothetical protein
VVLKLIECGQGESLLPRVRCKSFGMVWLYGVVAFYDMYQPSWHFFWENNSLLGHIFEKREYGNYSIIF